MTRLATTPLLEVKGVSKRFGGHQALLDVALDLSAGEIHSVAGENGAGKSTLLAILSGALSPDTGSLSWEGRAVRLRDVRAANALGISMVHQEPQLVPSLSVAENICMGHLPARLGPMRLVDPKATSSRAARALAPLGVDIPPDRLVKDLRVADRQLVAIARALDSGARLILLDEPTSSISLPEIERLFETLRQLRIGGTAFFYVSHRLEELRAISDRITILRNGRVVLTARLAGMTNEAIVQAMSGRELATLLDSAPPAGETRLEVRGLVRDRRLHDLSLDVRQGEIVGLAGLMGAGRSRTLRSIFGAARLDRGDVSLRARDGALHKVASLRSAISMGMGFVPEDRRGEGLVMTASVEENIGLVTPAGAKRFGLLVRSVLHDVARKAVEALGVKTRRLDLPVRALSGGNQQKVVLARWVRPDMRVLLLDEPTRGVDVGAKADIYRHLRTLAAGGMGLLVASSEIPELVTLCDRIYVMRQGRIVAELPREKAAPEEILRLAMGVC